MSLKCVELHYVADKGNDQRESICKYCSQRIDSKSRRIYIYTHTHTHKNQKETIRIGNGENG